MTDDDCNILINIIKLLLNEKEEYVLRASGWAIRNIYNYNEKIYFDFLNDYAHKLPRIMLRNAIEMLEEDRYRSTNLYACLIFTLHSSNIRLQFEGRIYKK